MKNLTEPKNLLYFTALPLAASALFLAVIFGDFFIFEFLRTVIFRFEDNVISRHLYEFDIIIFINILFFLIVMVFSLKHKGKEVKNSSLIVILVIQIIFIFYTLVRITWTFSFLNNFSPAIVFLIINSVSLVYLSMAILSKDNHEEVAKLKRLAILCITIPVGIYIIYGNAYSVNISYSTLFIISMGLFSFFLFCLFRFFYIRFRKKTIEEPEVYNSNGEKIEKPKKVKIEDNKTKIFIIAGILPQLGLFINGVGRWMVGGIFGDFSSPWFHIIAILNCIFLLLEGKNDRQRLTLFTLRCITFVYIAYFTLIFIPFMPIGIIGIIYFGLGLLIFVPAVIFYIQYKILKRDVEYLFGIHGKNKILINMLVSFLVLPIALVMSYKQHGVNFYKALEYTEKGTDFNFQKVNLRMLEKSILEIREYASRNGDFYNNNTPILSNLYVNIALDGKEYNKDTVDKLEKIFFRNPTFYSYRSTQDEEYIDPDFKTTIETHTEQIDKGIYKTWVDFEIENISEYSTLEYSIEFDIPDGVFIDDYYLYVGDEKKQGLLTDHRAAESLYNEIVSTSRDPGLINYEDKDTISLKVFPFAEGEVRYTGLSLLHSSPEVLNILNETIHLNTETVFGKPVFMDGTVYVPKDYKNKLEKVKSVPKYLFIIDAGCSEYFFENIKSAENYIEQKNIKNYEFLATSYMVEKLDKDNLYKTNIDMENGLNLELAFKKGLEYLEKDEIPIFIVVTGYDWLLNGLDNLDIKEKYPQSEYFYNLDQEGLLYATSFDGYYSEMVSDPIINDAYKFDFKKEGYTGSDYPEFVYLADNGENDTIFINKSNFEDFKNLNGKEKYLRAFDLMNKANFAENNKDKIVNVKESMMSRILSYNTAFIVLETEEQEFKLLELQEAYLSGKIIDTRSPVLMSEPKWIYVLGVIGAVYILKKRKQKDFL